ncbi:hypothetical protein LTR08_007195 [Meristemomyces frigidus]|nr:hypothetical protein LTR08_007195 [Meristemomyces frigidus]
MSAEQERSQRRPSGTAASETPAPQQADNAALRSPTAARPRKPNLEGVARQDSDSQQHQQRSSAAFDEQLSPAAADRVFPIRSAVSVDPTSTPAAHADARNDGYFARARRTSAGGITVKTDSTQSKSRQASEAAADGQDDRRGGHSRQASMSTPAAGDVNAAQQRAQPQFFSKSEATDSPQAASERPASVRVNSALSTKSSADETGGLITARFKHIIQEGGHAIITGRDGETLQRCEDEPIHIPGAVQGFGLLIAFEEQTEGRLLVRVVSENSKALIGYTPKQLFALDSFTDILTEEQADNLLDHVDFIRDEDADVTANGPEVFTMSVRSPARKNQKLWCAMHINERHPNLVICEFELEDDQVNPLVPSNETTPEPPEDTLQGEPTDEEVHESTHNSSKPLRVLRSARKRKGEAAAMEVFNIMSQVQEQLSTAPNLDQFLKILVGVIKELTGFHRVMVYQFDHLWNGRVVTELVDPRATKDLYKGLNFPASDIPSQARDLYKVNKVRMLYDRDQETARLVCRTVEDLETPLDLTYSYLRAMSPIHLKYLSNMAVRSSMSISINAFDELWGLIACHSYGSKGMRVSFPIRKMCRLVGDSASRNIERLSYASRLQARKLINTVPSQNSPSGYIVASSEDLLRLFDADFGLLSIHDETKILGHLEDSQEALAMLEYLRMRRVTNVMTSQDIIEDFPDLRYSPGFSVIAGLLLVPLSSAGQDFIVFFRNGQLKEVKWAGNPYEKFIKEGTEGYLEPRKSFKMWSEKVVGKCREWTEEEFETAAVLCLVYGKFIEVWRQKEAALQNSQLTRLLLANSAHEVRTPLNAIINYLEIALEGTLDQETRENLAKSHSASKSLIYVINDLLDLTKTEEGGDLTKDEVFDLKETVVEATDMFRGDARRKNIAYEVAVMPGLPAQVIGDQRRVRQAISNVTANAIQNTTQGGVKVEIYVVSREDERCEVEFSVTDTGSGINAKKLDSLFRELEQVQSESGSTVSDAVLPESTPKVQPEKVDKKKKMLGLGLAVVARIVKNMNGQLRLKSEEGRGSRFVIQFPFDLPEEEQLSLESGEEGDGGQEEDLTPLAPVTADGPVTPPEHWEVTLVERGPEKKADSSGSDRRNSGGALTKKHASLRSRRSVGSMSSAHSNISRSSAMSKGSEADRLISAIAEPYFPNKAQSMSHSGSSSASMTGKQPPTLRPKLDGRHANLGVDASGSPLKGRPQEVDVAQMQKNARVTRPGEASVEGQGQPVRPVRMGEDAITSPSGWRRRPAMARTATGETEDYDGQDSEEDTHTSDHMRVLVAEDDPVNSRIIKKRLEKLGHEVFLTVNGEECSSLYGDRTGFFDVVLMDMQMPIVDGLTSAKMIRSFEKTHPTHLLSSRASLNRRVPIIAVSASLIEKERPIYMSTGFDGWILKPVPFNRLSVIMNGIVDPKVRKENLYKPGRWESGGWFTEAQKSVFAADTTPSGRPPTSAPGVKIAAMADDPGVKEEDDSLQSREQKRLLKKQAKEREEDGQAGQGAGDGKQSRERREDDAQQEDGQDPPKAISLPTTSSSNMWNYDEVSPQDSDLTITQETRTPTEESNTE